MADDRGNLPIEDLLAPVAQAFSRKALVYDDFGREHENLQRMRERVRQHVLEFLQPGDHLLELNAGTGADAAYFAGLGYRVHATDLAPGMVAQIQAKIEAGGLQRRMSAAQLSFLDLEQAGGPYDYAFSNMGGVNCTGQLERVVRGLECILKPGGYVTWVVMPPVCLWELAGGQLRRLKPGGVIANVEGVRFKTTYYSPGGVRRVFGEHFKMSKLEGLSVFTPPADRKDFSRRNPRLYRLLRGLDDHLSGLPPFRNWGDFYIMTLRYSP